MRFFIEVIIAGLILALLFSIKETLEMNICFDAWDYGYNGTEIQHGIVVIKCRKFLKPYMNIRFFEKMKK